MFELDHMTVFGEWKGLFFLKNVTFHSVCRFGYGFARQLVLAMTRVQHVLNGGISTAMNGQISFATYGVT